MSTPDAKLWDALKKVTNQQKDGFTMRFRHPFILASFFPDNFP
jgi:hypothetical protein